MKKAPGGQCGITVSDNGPGLPETTLKGALDFTVRVSNREPYVAPDRGAQGNALKTLLPMPHVLDPDKGLFIVEANGKQHVIRCGHTSRFRSYGLWRCGSHRGSSCCHFRGTFSRCELRGNMTAKIASLR